MRRLAVSFTIVYSIVFSLDALASAQAQTPRLACEGRERPIPRLTELSGVVRPAVHAEVKPRWSVVLSRFRKRVGDSVREGEVIADVDLGRRKWQLDYYKKSLKLAGSDLKLARSRLSRAKEKILRVKEMVRRGTLARAEIDKYESGRIAQELALRTVQERMDRFHVRLLEIEEQLRLTSIISPIDGVIVELVVDPDQITGKYKTRHGAIVARVEQPGNYLIEARALGHQISRIKVDQRCTVQLPGGTLRPCRVSRVGESIVRSKKGRRMNKSQGPGSYQVDLEFADEARWSSGVLVSASIVESTIAPRFAVPTQALRYQRGKTFLAKWGDPSDELVPVTVQRYGPGFAVLQEIEKAQDVSLSCRFW